MKTIQQTFVSLWRYIQRVSFQSQVSFFQRTKKLWITPIYPSIHNIDRFAHVWTIRLRKIRRSIQGSMDENDLCYSKFGNTWKVIILTWTPFLSFTGSVSIVLFSVSGRSSFDSFQKLGSDLGPIFHNVRFSNVSNLSSRLSIFFKSSSISSWNSANSMVLAASCSP